MQQAQQKQAQTTTNFKAWVRAKTTNALMYAATHCVAEAIDALSQQGFSVLKIELDGLTRPTIRIHDHPRLQKFIESGDAGYYSFGQSQQCGAYREGQFAVAGCRVVWTEVGH